MNAEPQFGGYEYPYNPFYYGNYFRTGASNDPQPTIDRAQIAPDYRFFLTPSTLTKTIGTTTSTTTITTTTYCTTSTTTLKNCSPSGRRRRGMALNGDKKERGLFYNEHDEDHKDVPHAK